jgi:hypothetical protein
VVEGENSFEEGRGLKMPAPISKFFNSFLKPTPLKRLLFIVYCLLGIGHWALDFCCFKSLKRKMNLIFFGNEPKSWRVAE